MRNEALPVIWSDEALDDLERHFAYLVEVNPDLAEDVAQELTVAADSLETFPYRGRRGLAAGTREMVAVHPYVIVYEVRRTGIRILRIWHAKQDRR